MNYKELREFLHFDEKESFLFMPNEIFKDLPIHIKSNHIPFTYSYNYLITYLYRYSKYGKKLYTTSDIKNILGYNPNNKDLNYIIKKNGLMDELEYMTTDKDFPIGWTYENNNLEFDMFSEFKRDYLEGLKVEPYNSMSRNYSVKRPEKAFHRQIEKDGEYEEGTFYYAWNTHQIPIKVFIFCMGNKELECNAFYIYSYLRHKNQSFNGYDISIEKLSRETGMTVSTVKRTLDTLKKFKLIRCKINQAYIHGLSEDERRANTYYTNDFDSFSFTAQQYDRAGKMNINKYREDKAKTDKIIDAIDDISLFG